MFVIIHPISAFFCQLLPVKIGICRQNYENNILGRIINFHETEELNQIHRSQHTLVIRNTSLFVLLIYDSNYILQQQAKQYFILILIFNVFINFFRLRIV